MSRQINTEAARALLAETYALAEDDFRSDAMSPIPEEMAVPTERLFASETQAYREALVGCAIARIIDPEIDIRYPATEDGDNAFSGRAVGDKIVTPFLRERKIPISGNAYLSSLRGGAKLIAGGAPRIQRDKAGFEALVTVVAHLRELDRIEARNFLRHLLRRFILLREGANIALRRIAKPNLEQLNALIAGLLKVKSGGRFAAYLATSMFQTLTECHDLGWEVEFQGINVADTASGAVGDITVRKDGKVLLGIEVTERPIDRGRVTMTFDEKVSPVGLADYLFITTAKPEAGAITAARSYTAVGHEMNFVELTTWLTSNLATIGPRCRAIFQARMIDMLGADGV